MPKKYPEYERQTRQDKERRREAAKKDRISKWHENERARQSRNIDKQTENDGKLEFLFLYWITSLVIKYVLPPFLKLFFKLIRNLIKSLLRKTFNFARLIFNFIFMESSCLSHESFHNGHMVLGKHGGHRIILGGKFK